MQQKKAEEKEKKGNKRKEKQGIVGFGIFYASTLGRAGPQSNHATALRMKSSDGDYCVFSNVRIALRISQSTSTIRVHCVY